MSSCRFESSVPTERAFADEFTGLPASGDAVASLDELPIRCSLCATSLSAGDRVTVGLRNVDGREWVPVAFRCSDDATDSVSDLMTLRVDDQAVAEATLEPTGSYDVHGEFDPDALTLGDVVVTDVRAVPDDLK